MKKLAIFVEGQTEQIFVEKLLKEIAGKNRIAIEVIAVNGNQFKRYTTLIKNPVVTCETKFYVLVYNSFSDNSVVSDMRDRYSTLTASGYERVIGLRDVYPIPISQKYKLLNGLRYSLIQGTIPIDIVLAVMEIEAWFLAEYNHFLKIDASLTPDRIQEYFGFNPKTDDMEARPKPSDDMKQIYNLVGKGYNKSEKQLNRLASNLDYELIYIQLTKSLPSLREFVGYLDLFLIP